MRYRAISASPGVLYYLSCSVLLGLCVLAAFAATPTAAQEDRGGPPAGTSARGSNPSSPSSPPDLVTISFQGCTVSEGASVTLEDGDGTEARFVDGQRGVEIAFTNGRITIEGPDDDYLGDHAVSSSDPGFDTDGDYAVVRTTGVSCRSAGTSRDGSSSGQDLDCAGFSSRAEAQRALARDPSTRGLLDPDDDGEACEDYDYGEAVVDQSPAEKQYGEDEVIVRTIPRKKLADTGGPPIGALLAAGLLVSGLLVLRRT